VSISDDVELGFTFLPGLPWSNCDDSKYVKLKRSVLLCSRDPNW
jgi:hypothetical protein